MINISKKLKENGLESKMVLQIHDELIFEVPQKEVETMKTLVKEAGLEGRYEIASAATSREEIGNPVYPPARAELARHGIGCNTVFKGTRR